MTAEYFPYARTGGLAEAVSGLRQFQAAAGSTSLAILPLYRTVRDEEPDLEPVGPRSSSDRRRAEEARIFRVSGPPTGARGVLHRASRLFNRTGIYGEGAVRTTPTTRAASLSSRWRR